MSAYISHEGVDFPYRLQYRELRADRTTVCYLKPFRPLQVDSIDSEEASAKSRSPEMRGEIDPSTMFLTVQQKKSLGRALRILGLRPYVNAINALSDTSTLGASSLTVDALKTMKKAGANKTIENHIHSKHV